MIEVKQVPKSSLEREEIYRMRYDVYIGEKRYAQKYVDHVRKTICEPLDEDGFVYGAFAGNQIVGTVRTNYASQSQLEEYFDLFGVNPRLFPNAALSTKLIVTPAYRGTTLALRLCAATYLQALRDGIRYGFIDCDPSMAPLYERLGFRAYRSVRYRFPERGEGVVMVIDIRDRVYLCKVHSPLLRFGRTMDEVSQRDKHAPVSSEHF